MIKIIFEFLNVKFLIKMGNNNLLFFSTSDFFLKFLIQKKMLILLFLILIILLVVYLSNQASKVTSMIRNEKGEIIPHSNFFLSFYQFIDRIINSRDVISVTDGYIKKYGSIFGVFLLNKFVICIT
jgi:hypothetical protein